MRFNMYQKVNELSIPENKCCRSPVVAGTPVVGTPSPQAEEHGKLLLGTCMVEIEKETSRCKDELDVNEKTNNGLTELVSTEGGGAGKLGTLVFKLRLVSKYVTLLRSPCIVLKISESSNSPTLRVTKRTCCL